ncbi:MAG: hypothetical protein KDD44_14195, partial [Bdellovibrionales bacterium]|nr:hypothetical protein [Bdellovibrionales bacterium]
MQTASAPISNGRRERTAGRSRFPLRTVLSLLVTAVLIGALLREHSYDEFISVLFGADRSLLLCYAALSLSSIF